MRKCRDFVFIVKTDSLIKGKGVHLHHNIEQALETVRFYMEHDTPVRVERLDPVREVHKWWTAS